MAEVTNEPIYEVLKAIQARLGNFEEAMREQRGQMTAIRFDVRSIHTQLDSVHTDITNIYQTIGALDSRMSRIERRLEIIDTPSAE